MYASRPLLPPGASTHTFPGFSLRTWGKRNESLERSRTKQRAGCAEVRRLMKSARCLSPLVDSLLGAVLIIPGSLASCASLLSPRRAPPSPLLARCAPTGHAHRETFRMIRRRRYEISIPADKIVEGSRLLRARAPVSVRVPWCVCMCVRMCVSVCVWQAAAAAAASSYCDMLGCICQIYGTHPPTDDLKAPLVFLARRYFVYSRRTGVLFLAKFAARKQDKGSISRV